jgi:hypothetical protein
VVSETDKRKRKRQKDTVNENATEKAITAGQSKKIGFKKAHETVRYYCYFVRAKLHERGNQGGCEKRTSARTGSRARYMSCAHSAKRNEVKRLAFQLAKAAVFVRRKTMCREEVAKTIS